jgi:nicotinamide mononucleotide transporter
MSTQEAVEYIAAAISMIGVWLTVRHHVACWIANATGALLYTIVFWQATLYANALLQSVFMIMSVYGWLQWHSTIHQKRRSAETGDFSSVTPTSVASTPITRASLSILFSSFCGICFCVFLLSMILLYATTAHTKFIAASYLDTLTAVLTSVSGQQLFDVSLTALSLWATWLTAHQHIENWLVWIVADILYCGLFVEKQLWATALLYGFFCIFAGYGYYRWSNLLKQSML